VKLRTLSLSELSLDDHESLQHIEVYRDLRQVMLDDAQTFRAPPKGQSLSWSRALFLNLTWWSAAAPSDVLCEDRLPADALAHAAWHHLARRAFADGPLSADAMFLGEAIASAFDLYLVGRTLPVAPESDFITTQVPAISDAALDAGMSEDEVEAMLQSVVDDPEGAFEGLRALLFDACASLLHARDIDDAAARLEALDGHRFAPLLHHYEVSNWILFARANAPDGLAPDARVRALHASLSASPASVDWLHHHWVKPRLKG
jgi:hypothetical protein